MKLSFASLICSLCLLLWTGTSSCSGPASENSDTTVELNEGYQKVASDIEDISGPMQINGTFKNFKSVEGRQITLYETEGKDRFVLDSAIIKDGKFTLDLDEVKIGVHRIGLSAIAKTQGEIILNPSEKAIDIMFKSSSMLGGLTFSNSEENTAYFDYQKKKRAFDQSIKAINKLSISKDEKRKKIYASRQEFDKEQDLLASQHPGTFFAKLVRGLQSPHAMNKDKYWDDLDFTDASLIRSQLYNNRLTAYMQVHAREENLKSGGKQGFYNCVDRLANIVKERGSDRVLEFILYTMSESFYKSGSPDVSHYVIDNYFYGDDCGDSEISDLFKMKAAGLRNLVVGNQPPDFVLPDPEGKNYRMSEVSAENEFTLVLFWASFCHKCKEEIPELKKIYASKAKKGFEILGVSVDYSRKDWTGGIQDQGIPWINVSDLTTWGGPVLMKYRVTKTPVMFLIDKNGTLVLRPESAQELKTFLDSKL